MLAEAVINANRANGGRVHPWPGDMPRLSRCAAGRKGDRCRTSISVWAAWALLWISLPLSCIAQASPETPQNRVWPPPPQQPRIEFLYSFSKARDLGVKRSVWGKVWDWMKNEGDTSALMQPFSLAVDSTGRLIIADIGAAEVKIFDLKKRSIKRIRGLKGKQFGSPVGVTVDRDDNIYVCDSGAGRVVKFSPSGKLLGFIGGEEGAFKRAAGIAFNPADGLVYVVDGLRPRVFAYQTDGKLVREFGQKGNEPGELNLPTFIAADRNGLLYVNDTLNFRIQMFSPDGKLSGKFGALGNGTGDMNRSKGVAVDSDGHVYVADATFSTVQIFNRDGDYLLSFGESGRAVGEFYIPAGVTIDADDRIYVADPFQGRIQVFQYLSEARPAADSAAGGGR